MYKILYDIFKVDSLLRVAETLSDINLFSLVPQSVDYIGMIAINKPERTARHLVLGIECPRM